MKKEEIHFADWHRILLGNAPLEFLVEVALRTLTYLPAAAAPICYRPSACPRCGEQQWQPAVLD